MLVFRGAKISVIVKLKEKYALFILRVYCVAHRTNLIVHTFSKLLLVPKIEALLQSRYNCNHIIMTLIANVDATMMFFPLVVNQHLKPHAFKHRKIFNPQNIGILWYVIKKRWIITIIFEKIIIDLGRLLVCRIQKYYSW